MSWCSLPRLQCRAVADWVSGWTRVALYSVYSCVVLVCKEDHVIALVLLMLYNVVVKSWKDCGVESFDLFSALVLVLHSCLWFHPPFCAICWKNFHVSSGPISLQALDDIVQLYNHLLLKIISTVGTIVFVIGVSFVGFENVFIISAIERLSALVFHKKQRMSMVKISRGPSESTRRLLQCFFVVLLIIAHGC